MIDAHSQADQHIELEEIIRLMDTAGVSRTILSARGQLHWQRLAAFAARHSDRITAAVRTKGESYQQNDPRYYNRLKQQLAMPQFGAMAEVLLWHAAKGNPRRPKAPQVVVAPDDERVQVALRAAVERAWPFVTHIEFSASGSDYDRFMKKFELLLRQQAKHPFVLIHMGQLETNEVRRLIETHSNVYFITSHSNPLTIAESREPWVNLFDRESLSPQWRKLITQHPKRFILGFDNVWAAHWGSYYLAQVVIWRKALSELPLEVAHAVAHQNAEQLWRLPPAH